VGAVAELHDGKITPLFHADELGVLQGNLERRLFEAGNRVARAGGEEVLDGAGRCAVAARWLFGFQAALAGSILGSLKAGSAMLRHN